MMALFNTTGIKNAVPGMGFFFCSFRQDRSYESPNIQVLTSALGYPLEPDGKNLFLETTHLEIYNITWKNDSHQVAFIVLEAAVHTARGKRNHQCNADMNPAACNYDYHCQP